MRFHIELTAKMQVEDVFEVGSAEAASTTIERIKAVLRHEKILVKDIWVQNLYRTDEEADEDRRSI